MPKNSFDAADDIIELTDIVEEGVIPPGENSSESSSAFEQELDALFGESEPTPPVAPRPSAPVNPNEELDMPNMEDLNSLFKDLEGPNASAEEEDETAEEKTPQSVEGVNELLADILHDKPKEQAPEAAKADTALPLPEDIAEEPANTPKEKEAEMVPAKDDAEDHFTDLDSLLAEANGQDSVPAPKTAPATPATSATSATPPAAAPAPEDDLLADLLQEAAPAPAPTPPPAKPAAPAAAPEDDLLADLLQEATPAAAPTPPTAKPAAPAAAPEDDLLADLLQEATPAAAPTPPTAKPAAPAAAPAAKPVTSDDVDNILAEMGAEEIDPVEAAVAEASIKEEPLSPEVESSLDQIDALIDDIIAPAPSKAALLQEEEEMLPESLGEEASSVEEMLMDANAEAPEEEQETEEAALAPAEQEEADLVAPLAAGFTNKDILVPDNATAYAMQEALNQTETPQPEPTPEDSANPAAPASQSIAAAPAINMQDLAATLAAGPLASILADMMHVEFEKFKSSLVIPIAGICNSPIFQNTVKAIAAQEASIKTEPLASIDSKLAEMEESIMAKIDESMENSAPPNMPIDEALNNKLDEVLSEKLAAMEENIMAKINESLEKTAASAAARVIREEIEALMQDIAE